MWYAGLIERGWIPEAAIRIGIRRQLRERLATERVADREEFVAGLGDGPIAISTDAANDQHYEVPPEFFAAVLGPNLKYSSGLWNDDTTTLGESEENMLALTLERAGLEDGQSILDLGCGWGSMSLYAARHLPNARIHSVSNSQPQIDTVRRRAAEAGLANVTATRADINEFEPGERFDRIVSVEMFEHMRNYRALLRRISGWLAPEGRLFVHHFAHREFAYPYESSDDQQWMARHFFTGGIMPSADLLRRFDADLAVVDSWDVNGAHYHRTCEAWLQAMHAERELTKQALRNGLNADDAARSWNMWRVFFLACSELFRYGGGKEWFVAHRLLAPAGEVRHHAA